MWCLLVFDGLNDTVFINNDESFSKHVQEVAVLQGLISKEDKNTDGFLLRADVVMQLFSPLITSQRIMLHHFSNPYSEIKCYDGLNVIFKEYFGYLFVSMGYACIQWLKRYVCAFISVLKHTCGPDISKLKTDERFKNLMKRLLNTWCHRMATEQSVLVEAIEQLRVPTNIASICLKSLTEAAEKIKSELSNSPVHAFIMVDRRFLSLYSTRNANELFFNDILLLSLIGDALGGYESESNNLDNVCGSLLETSAEYHRNDHLAIGRNRKIDPPSVQKESINISTNEFVFLLGKQKPHAVHIYHITPHAPVFLIYEIGNEHIHCALLETLHSLCALQDLHARGTTDREVVHSCVEVTDNFIKKLGEFLKKKTSLVIDKIHLTSIKTANKKWEVVKKQYQDYLRSHNVERLSKIDSAIENIISLFRNVYSKCLMDVSLVYSNRKVILPVLQSIQKTLQGVVEVPSAPNTSNLNLGTKSTLSINKYLEEFPGLVHFIYIDRSTHRYVAPNLEFSSQETKQLTRKKIWSMVEFAWLHLQEGRTTIMWKDTIFNYSYFLWFEDTSGTPMKPKICPTTISKTSLQPGVLDGDFYLYLTKKCFPMSSANKIRCYELFSIHLGLATPSCVLEQSRRLTATIWEVTGIPTNPLDLL